MQELEKILEEIEQRVNYCKEHATLEYVDICAGLREAEDIIRKHMNDGKCGECSRRKWYQKGFEDGSKNNDSWVSVEERLPEKNEYFVEMSGDKDFPNGYYKRLEIAYMTDTIEYVHGYYDGYKWMDKYLDTIKNVVAWRIHEPYRPERSEE